MNSLLKQVKDIYAEACVSIIFNTHRTKPDNAQDPITLKNLIKEAEDRLYKDYEKRFVWPILENLQKISSEIDHNYNLESLVIFANQQFAGYTRLPINVTDRVTIDNTFATRDLVRALHQESAYYILVLSRQQARLIEAFNDRVVEENAGKFPLKSKYWTTDKLKLSMADGQDNLIEEFFNQVDKTLLSTIEEHPLPIVLATETRNYDHYMKVADKKGLIIGHINRNRDDDAAHHIAADAWQEVLALYKERNEALISELHQAVSANKFVSDLQEIWNAVQQGRGKTLFVKRDYFQPALIEGDELILLDQLDRAEKGAVDDIVDEIIEQNLAFGGNVVFLSGNELDKFGNIALTTRF